VEGKKRKFRRTVQKSKKIKVERLFFHFHYGLNYRKVCTILKIDSKKGLSYMNNSVIMEEITKRIEMKKEFFEKLVSQKKYLISQLTNYRELLLEELRKVDREIANFEDIWKENKTKKAISTPRKGKRVFPPPGTILKAK